MRGSNVRGQTAEEASASVAAGFAHRLSHQAPAMKRRGGCSALAIVTAPASPNDQPVYVLKHLIDIFLDDSLDDESI